MCAMKALAASPAVSKSASRQQHALTLAAVSQSFATLPSAETCGAAANDYLGSSAASAQLHTMLQEENGFTAQVGRTCNALF